MRKQYYFQPSAKGYFAWDVDRLIELSKKFQVKEIRLNSIKEMDENHWFHDDEPTCRAIFEHTRLIGEADLRYPIILSENGRVMDGMHRVGKAFLEGRDTIKSVQFEKNPVPDYVDVLPDDLPYD